MFGKAWVCHNLLNALAVAVIVGALSLVGCRSGTREVPVEVEHPGEAATQAAPDPIPADEAKAAADFELPMAGGGTARLSDYQGKVLVLDFWATNCKPCVEELPEYQKLHDSWDHDSVAYLGMSQDVKMAVVEALLEREKLTLPMALCDAETREAYLGGGIVPIPQTRIIDQNGLVRYAPNPGPWTKHVGDAVARLLAEADSD
jgi:peroxiredoxin